MLAGLVLIAALYVGPVEKYLRVQRELRQERALVGRLQNVHNVLGVRVVALHYEAGHRAVRAGPRVGVPGREDRDRDRHSGSGQRSWPARAPAGTPVRCVAGQ